MKDEELVKRLQEAFKLEAEERLASLCSGMLKLEKTEEPDKQKSLIEVIFREAHSMKGAARAVNLIDIEGIFQSLEGIFSAVKKNDLTLSPELFDTLHYCLEIVGNLLASPFEDQSRDQSLSDNREILSLIDQLEDIKHTNGKKFKNKEIKKKREKIDKEEERISIPNNEEISRLIGQLEDIKYVSGENIKNKVEHVKPGKPPREILSILEKPLITETIRIPTSKLDSLLLKAEEMVSVKLMLSQQLLNFQKLVPLFAIFGKKYSYFDSQIRSFQYQQRHDHFQKDDSNNSFLDNMLDSINWSKNYIQSLEQNVKIVTKAAKHDLHSFSRMVDDLLDDMKRVMMLPAATLVELFPKIVRDISREQGKEVDLRIQGEEIEIDRRILEEMKDPFIHLLRNSLDHGIEDPKERIEKQKPRSGTIDLIISQNETNKVTIILSDDGKGIDIKRVKEKAIKLGIISKKEAEHIKDHQALQLIFRSELSTSPIITEISGRGLGLAIVHEKIEKLGGTVSIETQSDKGSTFIINLPVTVATFKGVLIRVADNLFIVPNSNIERILRIKRAEVKIIANRATITISDDVLPLISLSDLLELPKTEERKKKNFITAMILGAGEKRIAFIIDEILGKHEVLVKSLGKQLVKVPNIAGATVLGSGKVVPILNVQDILLSSQKIAINAAENTEIRANEGKVKKNILIVEDSITSRMLIKDILETAGYSVKTAVDGRDGYTILKTQRFDAVVSDVEMPRMSGFELTKKIRSEKELAEIPVVLVTSLESRQDREKGIDVGANAYIVKKNFDQSNLLEVIDRLI